jgi:hypothetical protein
MYRTLVCAGLALFLCAVTVTAKEYKGTIVKIDGDVVKVKVGDEEKTFVFGDKTAIVNAKDEAVEKEKLAKRVEKAGDKGVGCTIDTEEKDGKEVAKDGKIVLKQIKLKGKK